MGLIEFQNFPHNIKTEKNFKIKARKNAYCDCILFLGTFNKKSL